MTLSQADIKIINTAEWELWYQDNFELECPRQMDLSGRGLVEGLMELWAHHLYETIQPNGFIGFSRFNLWWNQRDCSVNIVGEKSGQIKLRQWVYGEQKSNYLGCMHIADKDLLRMIAGIHSKLIISDQTSETIIKEALLSNDKEEFIKRITR